MDAVTREAVWRQYGAAIDMLENAVVACPEGLWFDDDREPPFWYLTFHTLFWLDLYLSGGVEGFAPPPPFGLEELDPAGVLPERPYSQAELRTYLAHCRAKCRATIAALDDASAARTCSIARGKGSFLELQIYNLRHVQHGAGQLNLILREVTDSAPRWVGQARDDI